MNKDNTKLNGVNDRLAPPLRKERLGGVKICSSNLENWYAPIMIEQVGAIHELPLPAQS
jgi:hypothetical protein